MRVVLEVSHRRIIFAEDVPVAEIAKIFEGAEYLEQRFSEDLKTYWWAPDKAGQVSLRLISDDQLCTLVGGHD